MIQIITSVNAPGKHTLRLDNSDQEPIGPGNIGVAHMEPTAMGAVGKGITVSAEDLFQAVDELTGSRYARLVKLIEEDGHEPAPTNQRSWVRSSEVFHAEAEYIMAGNPPMSLDERLAHKLWRAANPLAPLDNLKWTDLSPCERDRWLAVAAVAKGVDL